FVALLRPRRERPRYCRRTAKRDNEFPSSDADCHVTLPRGSCNREDDITPGRAALRDFKPAYVSKGATRIPPFGLLCQLPPATDITSQMLASLGAIFGLMHRSNVHRYSITSSASSTNESGIVSPIPLAALRLTINS